jgi:hypothetical protein
MATTPTERYRTRLAGWIGIFVAMAVAGPAASRFPDRGSAARTSYGPQRGAFLLVLLERALRSQPGTVSDHEPVTLRKGRSTG